MTLAAIRELLKAEVLSNNNSLDQDIQTANASDLMSDVLAFAVPGSLLLTGLTNAQVIRTCEIAGICAVVFLRGKKPAIETVKMSEEFNIPVMATKLTMFEACGVLYTHGLKPQSTKHE